jgi:hypothetical protein
MPVFRLLFMCASLNAPANTFSLCVRLFQVSEICRPLGSISSYGNSIHV